MTSRDDNGVASFDLIRNHRANDSVFLSKKCRPLSEKMQVNPPFSFDQMGAWWWPSGASKRQEGNYENLRPMPWKTGTQPVKTDLVFDSLDKCLEAEEIMRADQESKFQRRRAVFN